MPWTFAHPAAILPLRKVGRVRLPLLGLVIGTVAPDLGYYIGRFDFASLAHTFRGVFLLCVPASVLLALLAVRFRHVLTAPLPDPHRTAVRRLAPLRVDSLGALLVLIVATLIGAITHVVWDSFTHATGAAVQSLAVLRTQVGAIYGRPIFLYNVLQHASTIAGVAALGATYRRWLGLQADSPISRHGNLGRYGALSLSVLIAAATGLVIAGYSGSPESSAARILVRVAFVGTSTFGVLYVMLGIIFLRADAV